MPIIAKNQPTIAWKEYQSRVPSNDEVKKFFKNGYGIGGITGAISGNLEDIDFDDAAIFDEWWTLVQERVSDELFEKLLRCPLIRTPRPGNHFFYRCRDGVSKNQDLAYHELQPDETEAKVLIETRGEGGYAVLPGSPASVHKNNQPYRIVRGNFGEIPVLTAEERGLLLATARSLTRWIKPPKKIEVGTERISSDGRRPGDEFNKQASWSEILKPHRWTIAITRGDELRWRAPGQHKNITSAVSGFSGTDLFYVFSNNCTPFISDTAYSKFAVYALLNHNGDFRAAAKDLAAKGYGEARIVNSRSVPENSTDSRPGIIYEFNTSSSWETLGCELESIDWDWNKWTAKGFLGITAASSGFGKSALMLYAFGRTYILGKPWPDGSPYEGETGCIGWGEGESAQKLNIIRARKYGLPLNKILPPFQDPKIDLQLWMSEHQDAVWKLMRRPEVRSFVVDSLRGCCKGDENSSEFISNTKVLADIAKDVNKPIFAIHHFKKRSAEEKAKPATIDDLRGSSAIVQLARLIWAIDCPLFEVDQGEQKRLTVIKSNLDTLPEPIGFTISDTGLSFGQAPQPVRQESAREKAGDLLLALLRQGPRPANELQQEVEGAGLSWFAAKKAKEKLGILSTRDGINQCWHWSLPMKGGSR